MILLELYLCLVFLVIGWNYGVPNQNEQSWLITLVDLKIGMFVHGMIVNLCWWCQWMSRVQGSRCLHWLHLRWVMVSQDVACCQLPCLVSINDDWWIAIPISVSCFLRNIVIHDWSMSIIPRLSHNRLSERWSHHDPMMIPWWSRDDPMMIR